MDATNQTKLPEEYILKYVKYAFALIIIVMGAYGYHRFFVSDTAGAAVWFVVLLFAIIEIAILTITTIKFSSWVKQEKTVGYGLAFAILLMWLISGVGIDQTIWGLVENKYHSVALQAKNVDAQKESEQHLHAIIKQLQSQKQSNAKEIEKLLNLKIQTQKLYNKKERRLRDIIYYNGNRCDLSVDCSARKKVGENALDLTKQELDAISRNIKQLRKKRNNLDAQIENANQKIDTIVSNRVAFEAKNRVTLDNKEEEAIVHVKLMEFINHIAGLHIKTPERAYVMLLSFVVYPIYILFIAFVASNLQEMKAVRAKQQEEMRNKKSPSLVLIAQYLKKLLYYIIKTRIRKVKEIEVEKEVEVIKEVEKVVYKDGKEIVTVEVPHFIDKEVVVEKIVEKPIIEKEFITIPADVDLNEFNKLTNHGSIPQDLAEVLKKYNLSSKQGANDDKYRVA